MRDLSFSVQLWLFCIALIPALAIGEGRRVDTSIIPAPLKQVKGQGQMTLNPQTLVRYSQGAQSEAELLADGLRIASGLPLRVEELRGARTNSIDYVLNVSRNDLGPEGYWLQITRDRARALSMEGPGVAKQPVAGNMLFHDRIAK